MIRPTLNTIGTSAVAAVILFTCQTCSKEPAGPPSPPPDATYVVRGLVTQLPLPNDPMTEFRVKHEAIHNYADKSGAIIGMGTMNMPFPISDESRLRGLAIDDKIEVTFAIWWKPAMRTDVLSVRKLPPETELHFGPASPVKPE